MSGHTRLALLGGAVVASIAACGSSGGPASSSSAAATSAASTPAPTPSTTAVLTTATATVAGASETILTTTAGKTLYYRTTDTSTNSTCSSAPCNAAWPALLLPEGTPAVPAGVTGTLALLTDPNGRQVLYNGHPLYTFASDSAPGDTKGEGVGGTWHVATPSLAVTTAAGSSGSPYAG